MTSVTCCCSSAIWWAVRGGGRAGEGVGLRGGQAAGVVGELSFSFWLQQIHRGGRERERSDIYMYIYMYIVLYMRTVCSNLLSQSLGVFLRDQIAAAACRRSLS